MGCDKTIMVVEDEPNDRTLIVAALRQIGVTGPIQLLSDGEDAIAYMMGEDQYFDRVKYPYPSFIITDLKMPNADGFAVLQHLKANPVWAIIPTVVLSASHDPDDIRTAYLLGASAYHVKPNTFEDLRTRLKILHDYWMTCEIPDVDTTGKQLRTQSRGKLGERFPQPSALQQSRVNP